MANDQLSLYNRALTRHLGERKLASLTENREPRRVLDDVWPDAIKYCLEQGQWKFALRTSKLTYSPSVDPEFGYQRGFEKPDDCVRLVKMCSDEYLDQPLLRYAEEANWWFCDLDDIYVSYVSNSIDFGGDYANWPETFARFVALHLADSTGLRITQSERTLENIAKDLKTAKKDALSKDALQGPTQFLPQGSWLNARRGGRNSSRYDGGSRRQLIG